MKEDLERYFVETVRNTRHGMYRVALALLHSPADAEDAVSRAVEVAWRHLPRLRQLEALPAYLMKSAVNAAKDELRRRKKAGLPEEALSSVAAPDDGSPIAHYVSGLPEKHRIPVLLKFGENMTEKEIAITLGLPRGTVSSRISRALDMLRKEIKKEEAGHA